MRTEELFILKCDVILDPAGWRIEYMQQGIKVKHRLNATTRDTAIKEAIMQGFTKIAIWRNESPNQMLNDGTVVVPKYTRKD
jgi:hypothetical protein